MSLLHLDVGHLSMYICVNTLTCSQVDAYDAPEQIKASIERITDELAFIVMVYC